MDDMYIYLNDKDTDDVNEYNYTLFKNENEHFDFFCEHTPDEGKEIHTDINCSRWQLLFISQRYICRRNVNSQ